VDEHQDVEHCPTRSNPLGSKRDNRGEFDDAVLSLLSNYGNFINRNRPP
jgi:hypothetical protein